VSKMISSTTKSIAFRLPIDACTILERRAAKKGIKVSEYLKRFVTYDARRKR